MLRSHWSCLLYADDFPQLAAPLETPVLQVELVIGEVVSQPGPLHLHLSQEVPQLRPLVSCLPADILWYDETRTFQQSHSTEYLFSLNDDWIGLL